VRDERREDLAELRHVVDARQYRRFATARHVGDAELFVEAPTFRGRPEVAVRIGRLGFDGILDAAGVACWSASDLNLRGPVAPFVAAYGPRRRAAGT
jgi:hypothetical protein